MPSKRPIGRNNLDKALHRLFKDDVDYFETRSMMANVLVGQFLHSVRLDGHELAPD